jgi:hypothetical protein
VIAAEADKRIGSAGVCPGCRLQPYFLGDSSGDPFDVTDKKLADSLVALTDAGAWIISNSWGPIAGDPRFVGPRPSVEPSDAVRAAIDTVHCTTGKGIERAPSCGFRPLSIAVLGWSAHRPIGAIRIRNAPIRAFCSSAGEVLLSASDDKRDAFLACMQNGTDTAQSAAMCEIILERDPCR